MIKVYFQTPNNSYADLVATFKNEALYMLCLPLLTAEAEKADMIVTESIEQDNEVPCEGCGEPLVDNQMVIKSENRHSACS